MKSQKHKPTNPIQLDMSNPHHRSQIVQRIKAEGTIVGIKFITYGLLIDAVSPESSQRIAQIKGKKITPQKQTASKTLTIIIDNIQRISSIIDEDNIHPSLVTVLKTPSEFARRVEGRALINLPIKPHSQINNHPLHEGVVSLTNQVYSLQFLYLGNSHPDGHKLVTSLYAPTSGVKIPAVTSLNYTGEDTITDHSKAYAFFSEKGISTYITDSPTSNRSGSYPIIKIHSQGIDIVRQGNLPPHQVLSLWPELNTIRRSYPQPPL